MKLIELESVRSTNDYVKENAGSLVSPSMVVARAQTAGRGQRGNSWVEAKVKWPNDIYVGDRKICGILIEHSLMGAELMHTIAGAGVNVNQKRFLGPAPNPVSMWQLLGRETQLAAVRDEMVRRLESAFSRIADEEGRQRVHKEFSGRLWRGDGKAYPFGDRRGLRGIDSGHRPRRPSALAT